VDIYACRPLEQVCRGIHLKGSVNACGWPYLDELRGKFIFVPTSGSYAGENRKDALERLCFVTGGFGDVIQSFSHGV
jgi:hypothetical protein